MAGHRSPDEPNGGRKRKAGSPAGEDSPGGRVAGSNSVQRRAADDDAEALLRGALEFRRQTGLLPTRSNMPAFYESVRGSLRGPLSQDRVYNKLRHLRHKFSQPAANGHGPQYGLHYELATKLWPANEEKNDKKEVNKKKQKKNEEEESKDAEMEGDDDHEEEVQDGEEPRGGRESYPNLAHAAAEHWKAHRLSKQLLEAGLKLSNPSKAKALEEKWKRLSDDEMKFQVDWLKTCGEIFVFLKESHRGRSS